ncbi:MAG: CBS domain-containing protein [Xanthomonadaceae bacterium]|nr:CBS domain-containing protein [Xanthomonadaceae bacterium]
MRIADICTRQVVSTDAAVSVHEAAEMMRKHHVGSLVVTEQPNGERIPIGFITDRDIVLAVVAVGISTDALMVSDIMNRNVATCTENEDIFDAIETMRARGVRRLPVLDSGGGLTGMLSADDIYGALGTHMRELGAALTHEQAHEMNARI